MSSISDTTYRLESEGFKGVSGDIGSWLSSPAFLNGSIFITKAVKYSASVLINNFTVFKEICQI